MFEWPAGEDPIRLDVRGCRPQPPLQSAPFHVSRSRDGSAWTEFHRAGDDYLLRFPGIADFWVSADGREVSCTPAPCASAAQIERLWLNQALPLARSKHGEMVFHGSCVDIFGRAVAFIGESGRGKSTLAAKFASHGHGFLTDDALFLRRSGDAYLVSPSQPAIRLWADSRKALTAVERRAPRPLRAASKVKIPGGAALAYCDAPRALATAYFLADEETDDIDVTCLSARETLMLLLRNSFLLDVEDRALTAAYFERAAVLSNRLRSYRLNFPRRFDDLDRLASMILAHVVSQVSAA